ncbi:hypothetical protein AAFF_G00220350, partial [Aldrovandia affinis]
NHEKETALHCAAQYGHSEVVSVLLQELTDPTMRNSRCETPLDLAALYGRLQVVRMLVNAHPNLMGCSTRKHTPLHLAARNGHRAAVQVLLEAGMDVNSQVRGGRAGAESTVRRITRALQRNCVTPLTPPVVPTSFQCVPAAEAVMQPMRAELTERCMLGAMLRE